MPVIAQVAIQALAGTYLPAPTVVMLTFRDADTGALVNVARAQLRRRSPSGRLTTLDLVHTATGTYVAGSIDAPIYQPVSGRWEFEGRSSEPGDLVEPYVATLNVVSDGFPQVVETGSVPTIDGLLQTAQSVAAGYSGGQAPIGTTPILGSWMLTGGILMLHQASPWAKLNSGALAQLIEQNVILDGATYGETGLHATVKKLRATSPFTATNFIVASVATQGLGLSDRDQTAANAIYTNALAVVTAMKSAVEASGYVFGGVPYIFEAAGGVTDANDGNYYTRLLNYQSALSAAICVITGQTGPIPMFLTQPTVFNASVFVDASDSQVRAASDHPDRFAMVGPLYPLTTTAGGHLVPQSNRSMGSMNAQQALQWASNPGTSLAPLPNRATISRVGSVYTIDIDKQVVQDTSVVADTPAPLKLGWAVATSDGGAHAPVTAVSLGAGPNGANTRFTITCPTAGANYVIRYACGDNAEVGSVDGPPSTAVRRRGCFRAVASYTDADGNTWHPYLPSFEQQVA